MARRKKTTTAKQAPKKRAKVSRAKLQNLAEVGERFSAWRPASEVLVRVRAQPTIFPQFDRAVKVGGYPLQRVGLVHGPSGHGKTALALGLGLSFLQGGHFFAYVDAEFTTPASWLQKLMAEHATNPGFVAIRPNDYEEVVHAVRDLVNTIAKARNEKLLDENTTAFIVIDSLRKLVPKNLLVKMLKGKDGMDGAKGRAAMMKAALNAQWLDELTPLLYHTNASLLFIARETENPDAAGIPFAKKYKVGGGKAVLYDSSLAMRVTRRGYVTRGSGETSQTIGERHQVTIHKTKIGGREDKVVECDYYTSNGVWVPEGFDRARDVVEGCIADGLIKKKTGGRLEVTSTGETWRSVHDAVKQLSSDEEGAAETLAALEQDYRLGAS